MLMLDHAARLGSRATKPRARREFLKFLFCAPPFPHPRLSLYGRAPMARRSGATRMPARLSHGQRWFASPSLAVGSQVTRLQVLQQRGSTGCFARSYCITHACSFHRGAPRAGSREPSVDENMACRTTRGEESARGSARRVSCGCYELRVELRRTWANSRRAPRVRYSAVRHMNTPQSWPLFCRGSEPGGWQTSVHSDRSISTPFLSYGVATAGARDQWTRGVGAQAAHSGRSGAGGRSADVGVLALCSSAT